MNNLLQKSYDEAIEEVNFLKQKISNAKFEPEDVANTIIKNAEMQLYILYDTTPYFNVKYNIATTLGIGIPKKTLTLWEKSIKDNLEQSIKIRTEMYSNPKIGRNEPNFITQEEWKNIQIGISPQKILIFYTQPNIFIRSNTIKDVIALYESSKLPFLLKIIQDTINNDCAITKEIAETYLNSFNKNAQSLLKKITCSIIAIFINFFS